MGKKKIAFICVHNSCRSQIAEALGKHIAADVFESYSAGTLMTTGDFLIQQGNPMKCSKRLLLKLNSGLSI
mgnify:CR=1 FL=1